MRVETPSCWNDLTDLLWEQSFEPKDDRIRPYTAFRGETKLYDHLEPSLFRLGSRDRQDRERKLIDRFRMYATQFTAPGPLDWDILALAQHHGCPTRLLDWTSSPLVALHFATDNQDHEEEPGAVWCIQRVKTNTLLPDTAKHLLDKKKENIFSVYTLGRWVPSLSQFDEYAPDGLIWFEPPSFDVRIVNQYGFFSAIGSLDLTLDQWLDRHPVYGWKVVITPELKRDVPLQTGCFEY